MVAIAAALSGCTALEQQRTDPPAPDGPGPPVEPPVVIDPAEIETLVSLHGQRVGKLQRVQSRGVLEMRWVDEEGVEHREHQVNAQLRVDLPRYTALWAEKLGEMIFWVGSDDRYYWFFDLLAEEKTLLAGRHESGAVVVSGPSAISLRPLALLDLMGFGPIRTSSASVVGPLADSDPILRDDGTLLVAGVGAGGPVRVYFDRSSQLPARVESLNRDGAIQLQSEISEYRSVDVPGVSRAELPRVPTRIAITNPEGTVSILLALDRPTGSNRDELWDRVFDLSQLVDYLRPDRIEGELPREAMRP